jgi:hypothetical protein
VVIAQINARNRASRIDIVVFFTRDESALLPQHPNTGGNHVVFYTTSLGHHWMRLYRKSTRK